MKACVDIGGTKVAVSLAQGQAFLARRSEPTVKTGKPDALAQQIIRMIHEACAAQGVEVSALRAIGVCSCGPFVLNEGLIEVLTLNICGGMAGHEKGPPNDWKSASLEGPLKQAVGRAQVRVENDAVAALEAERRWGTLQGISDAAYVIWSTGIGVGLCVDGRVLRGKSRNAGHAGHSFVSTNTQACCGCGNVGDVESLVAGHVFERRDGAPISELFQSARAGNASALARIDGMCSVMGRLLFNLTATLDLQRISLGGSVFWHQRDLLLPRLQAEVRAHLPVLTPGVDLVEAGLGLQVGDYAALALAA